MITQDQYNEAILEVTGSPQWRIVTRGLENDIYNIQARALEANSWEEVVEMRGFAKGLAFIIGLRDNTKQAMDQGSTLLGIDADASL